MQLRGLWWNLHSRTGLHVPLAHELFGEVRNDSLCSAVFLRRNAFGERCNLGDVHAATPSLALRTECAVIMLLRHEALSHSQSKNGITPDKRYLNLFPLAVCAQVRIERPHISPLPTSNEPGARPNGALRGIGKPAFRGGYMAKRSSTDIHSDAPPSTLKDPNPSAAGLSIYPDDSDDLIGRTVTINRPRHELYAFWRDFRNLPLFMENIESVDVLDERRSHWVVQGPAGQTVEWDSVIVEDVPDELIAWRSDEGADVPNSGRIEFRDSAQRPRHARDRDHRLRPAGRRARQAGGEAIPARAEDPGTPRPAALQAVHGNRRDLDLRAPTRRSA